MLTEEQIENNKQRFIELTKTITRDGSEIDRLVAWLERSDFFYAPASTKYHAAYKGGLCEHSLNVYDSLVKLKTSFNLDVSDESILIVGLFHDISKANYYELYKKNIKDEQSGQWSQVYDYRVKPAEDRFLYGNHEETSMFMINSFVALTPEEQSSILHHHAGMSFDSTKTEVGAIYTRYTLAGLLHIADMTASFILER